MRISVIIPCLNCERYLAAAIDSVLAQTIQVAEVIIVDDGSADRSAGVAESFAATGNVRLIRQDHRGVSTARNAGIAAATGTHLLFLDADDLLHPQALEKLAAASESAPGAVGIMGCAWFDSTPESPTATVLPEDNADFFPRILRGNIGAVHTLLTPAELMRRAGGYRPGLRIFEDWECMARIALLGARLAPVPFVGAFYRRHPESIMARSIWVVTRDVVLGHVGVMETLCQGLLSRPELLREHGQVLFWSAWTALHRARVRGISWSQLKPLASSIEQIAHRGPEEVRRMRFARLIRLIGVRGSELLRSSIVSRRATETSGSGEMKTLPSWVTQNAG